MDNILKLLNFIYVIILLVFCLVKEIEIPGWGQNKKKAILNIVAEFYNKLAKNNVLLITKENLLGFTGNFIDIIVGFFNIVGWIKYDSPYRQFLGNSWLEKKTITGIDPTYTFECRIWRGELIRIFYLEFWFGEFSIY